MGIGNETANVLAKQAAEGVPTRHGWHKTMDEEQEEGVRGGVGRRGSSYQASHIFVRLVMYIIIIVCAYGLRTTEI